MLKELSKFIRLKAVSRNEGNEQDLKVESSEEEHLAESARKWEETAEESGLTFVFSRLDFQIMTKGSERSSSFS